MSHKKRPPVKIQKYITVGFPDLEAIALKPCPCCGERYNESTQVHLTSRCHPRGEVMTSYWEGFLYLTCGICYKPIIRVPVDRSLI